MITIKEKSIGTSKDKLSLTESDGVFLLRNAEHKTVDFSLSYLCLTYLEHTVEEDEEGYYTNNSEYFLLSDLELALKAFDERFENEHPFRSTKLGFSVCELASKSTGERYY